MQAQLSLYGKLSCHSLWMGFQAWCGSARSSWRHSRGPMPQPGRMVNWGAKHLQKGPRRVSKALRRVTRRTLTVVIGVVVVVDISSSGARNDEVATNGWGRRENVGVRASPERAASWLALVQSDQDWGPPLLIPLRYALRYPLLHRLPPMSLKRHEDGHHADFLILERKLRERAIIWILLCMHYGMV